MMEDIHIRDGIAAKLLLAGIVLAGATVGALALAPGASQATTGGLVDSAHAAFPIDNATLAGGSYRLSLDGKGNDPLAIASSIDGVIAAFPINNVTVARASAGVPSWGSAATLNVESHALALGQDMDPYALGHDMDPYALALGQDMDPY